MRYEQSVIVYLILLGVFIITVSVLNLLHYLVNRKHYQILARLKSVEVAYFKDEVDVLAKPFLDRTVGALAVKLVEYVSRVTPKGAIEQIDAKLERAGRPKGLKASDYLVLQGILGITVFMVTGFLLTRFAMPMVNIIFLSLVLSLLAIYITWFYLARLATQRQRTIKRSLPDIMDLLVVSVEAGLAFDMALMKVVERFQGPIGEEFLRALREMQLGRSRKDALKNMAERIDLTEFSSLANAIVQSEQLGVGLSSVLRMQADLIREKRQQWIEERAMKAPVKMLFPLVFCIFPSMFIVILGPAVINIMKVLGGM